MNTSCWRPANHWYICVFWDPIITLGPIWTVVTVWRLFFRLEEKEPAANSNLSPTYLILSWHVRFNKIDKQKHANLQTFTIRRVNKMWYNTSRRGQLQGRFPLCRYCVPRRGLQFGRICPTKYNCAARISSVRCSFLCTQWHDGISIKSQVCIDKKIYSTI